MNSSRTLWMGNIEKWMDEEYIKSVLATLGKKNTLLINRYFSYSIKHPQQRKPKK